MPLSHFWSKLAFFIISLSFVMRPHTGLRLSADVSFFGYGAGVATRWSLHIDDDLYVTARLGFRARLCIPPFERWDGELIFDQIIGLAHYYVNVSYVFVLVLFLMLVLAYTYFVIFSWVTTRTMMSEIIDSIQEHSA